MARNGNIMPNWTDQRMRLTLNELGPRLVGWLPHDLRLVTCGSANPIGTRGAACLSRTPLGSGAVMVVRAHDQRRERVTTTDLTGRMLILAPLARPVRIPTVPSLYSEDHPLRQSWPSFLDTLEQDITRGKHEFAIFAYKLLQTRTPKILRSQTDEEREDWIQEIIVHFTDDDCRILREYRNTGHPFAAWFITVVNHKAYDFYRKFSSYRERTTSIDDKPEGVGQPDLSDPADRRTELSEIIGKVATCIRKMSRKCQILLQAAAEEFNPREMLTLLGKDAGTNKQAADDLRACRKRLKALLMDEGVELGRYLG